MLCRPCITLLLLLTTLAASSSALISCSSEDDPPARNGLRDQEFDFGTHDIDAPKILEHRFDFVNDSGETLLFKKIHTTCGCTNATADKETIAPGEAFSIDVSLKLASAGNRNERVTVIFAPEGPPLLIRLTAKGRAINSFSCCPKSLVLKADSERRVSLIQTCVDVAVPEPVRIVAPSGLQVRVEPWSLVVPPDRDRGRVARWQAWLVLSTDTEISPGSTLEVIDGIGRKLVIALDGTAR